MKTGRWEPSEYREGAFLSLHSSAFFVSRFNILLKM